MNGRNVMGVALRLSAKARVEGMRQRESGRLGTGGEDGMERRGEKGKLSLWRRQHQEKNNCELVWSSKDVCGDGPGINTFEARLSKCCCLSACQQLHRQGKSKLWPFPIRDAPRYGSLFLQATLFFYLLHETCMQIIFCFNPVLPHLLVATTVYRDR